MAGEVVLVDRTFCQYWRRRTFAVAIILVKCLRTRAEVRPSHVVKKPEVMAEVQVKTMGLKDNQWSYWTTSDLVESAWTLLENGEGGGMGDRGD